MTCAARDPHPFYAAPSNMRPPRCAPPPARARGRPCTADSDGLRCLASGQDGLDRLFGAYKLRLPSLGGYLLDGVDLVPSRLLTLLTDVSKVELEFLREDEDEQRRIKRARGKEGGKEGGEGTEGAEADDAAARMAGWGGGGGRRALQVCRGRWWRHPSRRRPRMARRRVRPLRRTKRRLARRRSPRQR